MKLGIAVVYLVKEEDEKLLELHFRQIEKHTTVPYKIYATVKRLQPKFRKKLALNPKVIICDVPPTDLRISEEHAFNLEYLFERAIKDGVTHVAVLHVDSFPVRSGWAQELAAKLSDQCVFAAVRRDEALDMKPNLMCLLFSREFYLTYNPRLNLSEDENKSDAYKKYSSEVRHINETGVGYGLRAYLEKLSWYPLVKSNKAEDHYLMGSIYGDLVFHLGAAARDDKLFNLDRLSLPKRDGSSVFGLLNKVVGFLLPEAIKASIRRRLLLSRQNENVEVYKNVRRKLLADPESYLSYLCFGKNKN